MSATIHCTKCGTPLPGDAQFCASCGARVALETTGSWNASDTLVPGPFARDFIYAGFWLRVVASIIDSIIVNVVISIVSAVVANAEDGGLAVSGSLSLFGNWLYSALLEAGPWQATVGKKVLGLIVVDDRGNPISFGRATGRYFGKIVSALILLIGFFMAAFTARKQALHDMMAGTLVVKRPTGYVRT